jgi:hypothetical protein
MEHSTFNSTFNLESSSLFVVAADVRRLHSKNIYLEPRYLGCYKEKENEDERMGAI